MKKLIALTIALVMVASAAYAAKPAQGPKLSGAHYQFNIIGHPNNSFSGDYSNGRTIMVPLKTTNDNSPSPLTCNVGGGIEIINDEVPTYVAEVPGGVRIYFKVDPTISDFKISDRDALDGRAEVLVPQSALGADNVINFDIYLRVLGKPNQCMNINAYAEDEDQGLFFWAGSALISRKTGKSVYVNANDLFDVWFCQVDTATNLCLAGTTEELSVFDDVFESYFWQVLNDGTRNVQVRIYYR